MPRLRKNQCDTPDEVCKILNDLYQRIGTLSGQKVAKGVKELQDKLAELEVNQASLQAQIVKLTGQRSKK